MTRILLLVLAFFGLPLCAEEYEFKGKHFVASYLDCDPDALGNVDRLIQAMDAAVNASGATILAKEYHVFDPNGLTIVYLLSESHASLHTYPEFGACFVDLFTCGDVCSHEQFDKLMKDYLKPKDTSERLFLRGHEVQDMTPLTTGSLAHSGETKTPKT